MNKMTLSLICLLPVIQAPLFADESTPRWYSSAQQAEGEIIFQNNCAVCHGAKAEATPNWKQTNANGQYPPPPLNGSAHAWHHSLNALRITVRDGGQKIGGLMPSFEKVLSADERDKAIAYFQSQWSDELYMKWSKNFKVAPLKQTTTKPSTNPIVKLLSQRLNSADIDSVKGIANKQLYEVKTQGQTIYLTNDGRFAIIGNLINLETGKNLTPSDQ